MRTTATWVRELAAAVVGVLSNKDDEPSYEGAGVDWQPLVTSGAQIEEKVTGVALPTDRPAGLTALSAPSVERQRTEVSFATGG